jgi:tRNA threonylcarbamoyl adenosine modification protein (Sua5/YciO/YrdC/YwlC family)
MTKIVKLSELNPDPAYISQAAEILRNGGLVIIPTETVYGVAANMLDKKALGRLYEIKKRPQNKPFSIHIDSKEKIGEFAFDIPSSAYKLIDKFWPGPLTIILKSKQLGSVGLRMPNNRIALDVIGRAGVPVVCPSANIAGNPAPKNFQDAIRDLDGVVDFAIDAGDAKLGVESTIVDLTVEPLRVLRIGAISEQDLQDELKKKAVLFICTGNSCRSVMAKALLEKKLKEKGREDIEVLSAGIMMLGGLSASEETKALLKEEGIDVSGHRSQRLSVEMIKKADIILVMESLQEKRILELEPSAKNKLFLLKEFAKINDTDLNIEDPIGKDPAFYRAIFITIKDAIERISDLI